MQNDIIVREVGLRDGLQIINSRLSTEEKINWIDKAAAAGFREMEVTSMVPKKYLPQFEDAELLIQYCSNVKNITASVLVPNLKGAERALKVGADKITFIVSASESFSHANVRHSVNESLEEFDTLVQTCLPLPEKQRPRIIGGISCAFGCSLEGRIPEKHVIELLEKLVRAGADEIVLADTVGYADPVLVRNITRPALALLEHTSIPLGLHFHDTRGQGLANVVAALDVGVRLFDAALGGIGGCPNSPGATGNIATEDLVFLLTAMGLDTGIDLAKLIELCEYLAQILPNEKFYGHLRNVGLPKHFRPSTPLSNIKLP